MLSPWMGGGGRGTRAAKSVVPASLRPSCAASARRLFSASRSGIRCRWCQSKSVDFDHGSGESCAGDIVLEVFST